jgi:hypothetical protein
MRARLPGFRKPVENQGRKARSLKQSQRKKRKPGSSGYLNDRNGKTSENWRRKARNLKQRQREKLKPGSSGHPTTEKAKPVKAGGAKQRV